MIHSRMQPMSDKPMTPVAGHQNESPVASCVCPSCGGPAQSRTVSSVFWHGEEAFMIRGVPAMICATCGEDFISDATARELDRIREIGIGGATSNLRISLPVFNFGSVGTDSIR